MQGASSFSAMAPLIRLLPAPPSLGLSLLDIPDSRLVAWTGQAILARITRDDETFLQTSESNYAMKNFIMTAVKTVLCLFLLAQRHRLKHMNLLMERFTLWETGRITPRRASPLGSQRQSVLYRANVHDASFSGGSPASCSRRGQSSCPRASIA